MQHGLSDKLEAMAQIRFKVAVRKIQIVGKEYLQFKLAKKKQTCAKQIQAWFRLVVQRYVYYQICSGSVKIQAWARGTATRTNVERVRAEKVLEMKRVANAIVVLQRHLRRFIKYLREKRNKIENIKLKHEEEIQGLSEVLQQMKEENNALKKLLKQHSIEPPKELIKEVTEVAETIVLAPPSNTSGGDVIPSSGTSTSSSVTSNNTAPIDVALNSVSIHMLTEAQAEVCRLQQELKNEQQKRSLELTKMGLTETKMALTDTESKTKGRRCAVLVDNLKSENRQLVFDIASTTQKLALKEKEERRAYLRLKKVLQGVKVNNGNDNDGAIVAGAGEEVEEAALHEEEINAVPTGFNFEEQLDRLIAEYQQKTKWNTSMDNHVASLSTQLEQYSRDGTLERNVLQKQQETLERLMSLQQENDHITRKQIDLQYKLAMSEKSNGLLASKLSMKTDQLNDFLERTENSESNDTGGQTMPSRSMTAAKEEEELLEYLRLFSKEWGHPIYSELQNFVGYQTPTRHSSMGGAGKGESGTGSGRRRRRSLALF